MGTRSFVGYRHGEKLKGWYNAYNGDYFGMGRKALNKYLLHDKETLRDFFVNRSLIGDLKLLSDEKEDRIYIEDCFDEVFELDWSKVYVSLIGNYDFFYRKTNDFSYVYNLDQDIVEVYHRDKSFAVTRDNVKKVYQMFNNWSDEMDEKEYLGKFYRELEVNQNKQLEISQSRYKPVQEQNVPLPKDENGDQIFQVYTSEGIIFVSLPNKYAQDPQLTVYRIIEILPNGIIYLNHSDKLNVIKG